LSVSTDIRPQVVACCKSLTNCEFYRGFSRVCCHCLIQSMKLYLKKIAAFCLLQHVAGP
jgi:hypothetical protein